MKQNTDGLSQPSVFLPFFVEFCDRSSQNTTDYPAFRAIRGECGIMGAYGGNYKLQFLGVFTPEGHIAPNGHIAPSGHISREAHIARRQAKSAFL